MPWLAGEVLNDDGELLVVSRESRRGWLVYRTSPMAQRQGVYPGMTVSAASVICPGLTVRRRRPGREARRLREIGDCLAAFSPVVSVQPPETVLVEVRGSLGLFGGIERLESLVRGRLDGAGHAHRMACAPTPLAARQLARWGRDIVVEEKAALRSVLGAMPTALLNLDQKTAGRLARAGIRTLRDLWRLPAAGLARRFGTALVRELDRLQGRRPDPQPLHESPLHFSAVLMLDWATDDLEQLRRGAGHLLEQWVDYLRRSQRGTSGFDIECLPERGSGKTRLHIGVRQVSRDMDHLRRLTAERLERLELSEPVAGLVLESRHIHALPGGNGHLFETGEEAAVQWRQSEELLAMHLGGRGLDTLHAVAEHRPGLAWSRTTGLSSPPAPAPGGRRPLWLLEPPRALPWSSGPARSRNQPRIVRGPERIETGWWDRHDQRRDYYIATDARGRRLWVFEDLRRRQWYLHGLFA